MRKVMAKIFVPASREWDTFLGEFHQWGLATFETGESAHAYTVAIVERASGKIEVVLPENVTFDKY